MKVFVIHYTKLKERKQHIQEQLANYGFDVEFVTDHDRENLTDHDMALFDTDILTLSEMSLIRKHIACYERICKDNIDSALILEDDATLEPNFETTLENYMKQLPRVWDLFYIGEGGSFKFHIPDSIIKKQPAGTNVFYKSNYSTPWGGSGSSRCADSYVVSNRAAYRILEYMDRDEYKITKEHDHLLNEIALFKLLKVYWAEPTIVSQESSDGKFTSSLDGGIASRLNKANFEKEKLTFNQIKEDKVNTKQRQIEAQREMSAKKEQRLKAESQNKNIRNTDRPLSSLRPIAGRRPQMVQGQGHAKGRFSKFSF